MHKSTHTPALPRRVKEKEGGEREGISADLLRPEAMDQVCVGGEKEAVKAVQAVPHSTTASDGGKRS